MQRAALGGREEVQALRLGLRVLQELREGQKT